MDYKLQKQLKEAGFPGMGVAQVGDVKFITDSPPLSELIEACGEAFDQLEKRGDAYFAFASSKDTAGMKIDPYLASGSTPEEAVARLWLELNRKQ